MENWIFLRYKQQNLRREKREETEKQEIYFLPSLHILCTLHSRVNRGSD